MESLTFEENSFMNIEITELKIQTIECIIEMTKFIKTLCKDGEISPQVSSGLIDKLFEIFEEIR
jgi:hypothetical protein